MSSFHLAVVVCEQFNDFKCVSGLNDAGDLPDLEMLQSFDNLRRHIGAGQCDSSVGVLATVSLGSGIIGCLSSYRTEIGAILELLEGAGSPSLAA